LAKQMTEQLSISQCATLACLLEAIAPKVGNVHRGADFDDLTFTDFAASAVVIGPVLDEAEKQGVGSTVLAAIRSTRQAVSTNTNLGMVLLLAPLAAVPREERLATASVGQVLARLTADDCDKVYRAIGLAQPGGLGTVNDMDVGQSPPPDLLDAMRAAADRDLVARQYAENYKIVLEEALPALRQGIARGWSLTEAIIHGHLSLIAAHGDSLIARKCGAELSQRAATIAKQVLAVGSPGDEDYYAAVSDFDFWLRSDGNRRNPGSTADLMAAALFAGLRDQLLPPPWR
jgi:triphosphoribosyl-dephospho-CoA synthase